MNEFFGQPVGILTKARADALYAIVAGKAGGQIIYGGTAASENLILNSTAHATKGQVRLSTSTLNVDGSTNRVGINTITPVQALQISNGNIRMDQVAIPAALTAAVGAAGVLTGAYLYRVTYVTALGETSAGTVSAVVNPSSQQINLTNIPISTDSSVTSRNIYRTTANGSSTIMKLVTTIADNTTTTFSDNVVDGSLGVNPPLRNTTGGDIYIGTARVFSEDSSSGLVAIGSGAGGTLGATSSVAIGVNALTSTTTGIQSTAVGNSALAFQTTGGNNTAVGVSAGRQNQTGSFNVWIGELTGTGVSGNSNSQNTGIGTQAGSGITIGNSNVLIGFQTGNNITSGGSNVIIGASISAPSATNSNQLVIGNLIFSAGIDGTGTTLSSGNIGIGVVLPGTKLHTVKTDAGTNTVVDVETTGHYSSSTPAASFGTGKVIEAHSSNNTVRSMSRMRSLWTTATDASRATRSVISAFDSTGERDVIGWGANGSAALVGFFPTVAAAPVVQQTSASLTNNVTSGGSSDVIADFTSLTVYATDAATIRNDIYQLARKVKEIGDAMRTYGLLG